MNLGNLRTEAQRLAGRVDSDWNSRTRRFLNEAQEQWALAIPWPGLVKTETFVNYGTRTMVLPPRVKAVMAGFDRTNKNQLYQRNNIDKEFPSSFFGNTQGAANFMRERGFVAVTHQPAAGVLSFKTDSSDVFSCYVGGLRQDTTASGTADFLFFDKEQVNVGSSSVQTGTKIFTQVEVLGKDDFTPSDVVVRDSASNVIARIPALSYRAEYRQIELLDIPTSGTEIDIEYLQCPAPLVEDYQVVHPSVDPEYLIWYAAAMIHSAQGQEEQAQLKMNKADELIGRRIYKERGQGDKDWQGSPEYNYWGSEDQYLVY